jgi:hypothetical protein
VKLTAKQSLHRTLADLYRALDKKHAITTTYTNSEGETTIRTVEPHDLRTTSDGDIVITAMCRKAHTELTERQAAGEDTKGETAERNFRLTGISSYTIHRGAFTLTRPAPTTYERPAPAPADNADALFLYELARDRDDADYRPRVKLAA